MAISKYSNTQITGINSFFNTISYTNEQNLMDMLVQESISIYGQNMIYVPRNLNDFDQIYLSDDQSSYTTPINIEMYINSVTGFQPNDSLYSKFGLEIRSQVEFSVSMTRFNEAVTVPFGILRPREGDLIYFPIHHKLFQIKFADNKETFYPLGSLYTYKLSCEIFEYSNETFSTGIPEIDNISTLFNTNKLNFALTDENGNNLTDENNDVILPESINVFANNPLVDNDELKKQAKIFVNFSTNNPFGDIESE